MTNERENRLLVNSLFEFKKSPVEVQDSRKITDHFRGIYGINLKLLKKGWEITTCNWLDLETLEF